MDEESAPATPAKATSQDESNGQDDEGLEGGSAEHGRLTRQLGCEGTDQVFTCDTNFSLSKDEVQLLAKLEFQNR